MGANMIKISKSRRCFLTINTIFLVFVALVCLFPIIHIFAISLSNKAAVSAGQVKLWPVDFTLASYEYVLQKMEFWRSIVVSLKRVLLGGGLTIFLTILAGYPLSKETSQFKARTVYAWIFIITMLFGGGLIPTYMLIKQLNMLDSIWALVLPSSVQVFNVVLLLNFFRDIPKSLEEAALIDGASHWTVLWKIFMPIAKPAIATITLLTLVGHWNEWFSGLLYMNNPNKYPLQSYLQTIVIQTSLADMSTISLEEMRNMLLVSDRTFKAAQIFLGSLPILCVYPFLQKHFTKGLIMGSVKG